MKGKVSMILIYTLSVSIIISRVWVDVTLFHEAKSQQRILRLDYTQDPWIHRAPRWWQREEWERARLKNGRIHDVAHFLTGTVGNNEPAIQECSRPRWAVADTKGFLTSSAIITPHSDSCGHWNDLFNSSWAARRAELTLPSFKVEEHRSSCFFCSFNSVKNGYIFPPAQDVIPRLWLQVCMEVCTLLTAVFVVPLFLIKVPTFFLDLF